MTKNLHESFLSTICLYPFIVDKQYFNMFVDCIGCPNQINRLIHLIYHIHPQILEWAGKYDVSVTAFITLAVIEAVVKTFFREMAKQKVHPVHLSRSRCFGSVWPAWFQYFFRQMLKREIQRDPSNLLFAKVPQRPILA